MCTSVCVCPQICEYLMHASGGAGLNMVDTLLGETGEYQHGGHQIEAVVK